MRGDVPTRELFLNAWGKAMTRSGFDRVLDKHVAGDATRYPSPSCKRVSPRVLRHTSTFNTLQTMCDLRKVSS